jgi:hypothetical protein
MLGLTTAAFPAGHVAATFGTVSAAAREHITPAASSASVTVYGVSIDVLEYVCVTGAIPETGDDAASPHAMVPVAGPLHEAVAVTTTLVDVTLELRESAGAVASQMGRGGGVGEGAGVVPESGLGAGPGPGAVGAGLEPPDGRALQKSGPPMCSAPRSLYGGCGGVSTSGPT